MTLRSLFQIIEHPAKGLAKAKGCQFLLALLHIRSDQMQFLFILLQPNLAERVPPERPWRAYMPNSPAQGHQ